MHNNKLVERQKAARVHDGRVSKAIVAGLLERRPKGKSRVYAKVVPTTRATDLAPDIWDHVQLGTEIISDMNRSYWRIRAEYIHSVIDHTKMYVKGHVPKQGIENFWSLLKRMIRGTYVDVAPFHLNAYVDEEAVRLEEAVRFNERHEKDCGRFAKVLRSVSGRRLTYKGLTGKLGLSLA